MATVLIKRASTRIATGKDDVGEIQAERTAVEEQAAPTGLVDFLRDGLEMTSVKKGCDEGRCGAARFS